MSYVFFFFFHGAGIVEERSDNAVMHIDFMQMRGISFTSVNRLKDINMFPCISMLINVQIRNSKSYPQPYIPEGMYRDC